ncbi:NRAMP family divalent metal transporter [Cellulophaga tyrosinoxydans]|uniref:Mn2+ and Fe2+ transporters of the NRAMP family n=1 Tax=Cellulophaga tyrosinoxydans TaxID=504486 RepID=A0A1W1YCB5_9FLAO|nr:divalent metal cation transporter [Cellulophaga tyrosinoxydans]SMC33812.1 Mn2+ and Fe2+ transporters of the NRAMP family [Cellulophaga tyrosinoxydans]
MNTIKKLIKNLGPGLLFASMAIGTSHLVLSTKAGAQYGWIMVIPILLANIFKYPFFEFGVRYTNITNLTLIEGYLKRGTAYLYFYAFITFISTFTILAALYTVTAGLFINLFKIFDFTLIQVSLGLFIFISGLLIIGKYKFLELSLKMIVTILFVALIATTALVLFNGQTAPVTNFKAPPIFNDAGILFLIGLMGWMPTTVEASSWVSLWSIEKFKISSEKPTLKDALLEFNVGYILTAVFAIFFLIIGWMTLYGTNTILSDSAIIFADQLVGLFTSNIGSWAYILIAIAAFATMFSTCMTAHDAIARVSVDIFTLIRPDLKKSTEKYTTPIIIVLLAGINFTVISAFGANMGQLVALATFVSFIVAPLIGYMNYKNVTSDDLPLEYRPNKPLKILTYSGIIFLSLFSLYYFWIVLF